MKLHKEYLTYKSEPWVWIDGIKHWWEVTSEVIGHNGLGGYWIIERWRWNGSTEVLREQIRTLSLEESYDLEKEAGQNA